MDAHGRALAQQGCQLLGGVGGLLVASSSKAEVLFQLGDLNRQLGDGGRTRALLERVLRDYPAYERRKEVQDLLDDHG